MSAGLITVLTFAAALSSGLLAGVFFAFSSFMMSALARLPVPQAVAAMQAVNVAVLRSLFMGLFLGAAGLCAWLLVVSLLDPGRAGSSYLLAGSLLYLLGAFLVTVSCNVPLNNALAAVVPGDASSAAVWARYLSHWTSWNHLRTSAALAASAGFTLALLRAASAK